MQHALLFTAISLVDKYLFKYILRLVLFIHKCKGKGKTVPLQAWRGPKGSRKLRFPDFVTTAQHGSKVVSLTHRPLLPLGYTPGTHFCWGPRLRCCAQNRRLAGSIPAGVIGVFHEHKISPIALRPWGRLSL